ncbi:T9SS type A sorting domain-containing protein [Chryseobacterium sp. Tr-659]|nr:T9SS type A sorting domain-containing protein [Chryseobacterium sp. Tr-659]
MLPVGITAQSFSEVQTSLNNFYYAAADIADMDNNGTLDIVFNGAIDSDGDGNVDSTYNEVYQNNGTTLSPYAGLGGDVTHLGDIKFMDYNNDGLMDVISTGLSYMDVVNYKHYRFKNTGAGFVKEDELPGKIYGSLEVFDFNHDGKPDYALNGTQYFDGAGFRNTLDYYRNLGNGFAMTENWIEGTQNGSFKVVDLNNDHLLDLVIIGSDINGSPVSKVYMNQAGVLTPTQDLEPVASGKIDVADFNADGFQDMVVIGRTENDDPYFAVLMNDGTGTLSPQHIITTNDISDMSLNIGDLNNDGYYDFIISGNENYNGVVKTYIYNPANQNFTEGQLTGLTLLGGPGLVHLFDFNNDHHLDVLLGGFDWAAADFPSLTKVFKNNSTAANLKPTPPTQLNMTKNGSRFNFTWSGASDDKTPVNALRYEITIGTTQGAQDIAKYVVTTPSWFLDLDPGIQNVYWSVKSIDASKVYSEASAENMLGTAEVKGKSQLVIYPNPASDKVYIKGEKVSEAEMYSMDGKKLNISLHADQSIEVSHLPKGVYLLKLKIKNEITTRKLTIK